MSTLTLIEPGEVKVDLANFDLILQENFISTSHFFWTYSWRNVFRIFLNFWYDLKKWRLNVHFDVFSSEIQPRQYGAAPVKNSNQFPVASRVQCGGRRVLSGARSL